MGISAATAGFVANLEQKILTHGDNESALLLAQWLARFLTSNFCGVYHFKHVEESLARRFSGLKLVRPNKVGECAHVASEVYAYGGHTRLIRNLLAAESRSSRRVLLTRLSNPSAAAAVLDVDQEEIWVCDASRQEQRVRQLAEQFLKYKVLVLHLHPDDVTTAVALLLAKSVEPSLAVHFVNHSDHTFSTAVAHADLVFEVSGYGWSLRKARDTETRSTFLGIPVSARNKTSDNTDTGFILTGGAAYKYRPNRKGSLPCIIKALLVQEKSAHVVAIGPKPLDFWWWRLKLGFPSRFTRKVRMPHAEYARYFTNCSVYIDSYPVTGGTGFTEALVAGVNVAGIHGGPNGYGIADALRSESDSEFIDQIISLLRKDPAALAEQALVRAQAREVHSLEAVHKRFISAVQTGELSCPPRELLREQYEFDFRTEWATRTTPFCAGFSGRGELLILPTLLGTVAMTLKSATFAFALVAKAAVATLREFTSKITKK